MQYILVVLHSRGPTYVHFASAFKFKMIFPFVCVESLDEEGREECEKAIRKHRDWVVWSRARPMKGDCTMRGFEHVGKAIFCGKVKRGKKDGEVPAAEDETENDASDD